MIRRGLLLLAAIFAVAAPLSCSSDEAKPAEPAADTGVLDTGRSVTDVGAESEPPLDCSKIGCSPPPPCGESCTAPCGCCPNTTCGADASPDAAPETSSDGSSAG